MTVHPMGVLVFLGLCALLAMSLSNATGMRMAEIIATVFIVLSVGVFLPRVMRKRRGM
jgi:inner membrane protein involved in colicin E2 resistance